MNFLSSLAKSAGGQSTDEPKKTAGEESASTTDLFASAKVLAEAAQSQFNKGSAEVNNKKVAAAAADVLDAAQKYGKLDENQGIGQYVEKAETYLHQYGSATPAGTADEKPPAAALDTEETKAEAPASELKSKPALEPASELKSEPALEPASKLKSEPALEPPSEPAPVAEGDHEEEKKGGGADYLKMAGDFLSKK